MPENLVADAEAAMVWEHSLTPRRALKLYSKAVWFGAYISLALVMEGFDTKITGSLYAVPAFQEAFGSRQPDGSYEISAAWQSGIGGISGVTSILGMFMGGYVSERFGFRKTMMTALVSMPPIVLIFFFAPRLEVLAVAVFLMGMSFPLGIFQTVTTVYVTDISPTALRPYLTSCYSLTWALGQLLNAVAFRGTLSLPSPWSYRVPFALQWFWPIIIIAGVYFAPESPWWLVRQNRLDEAEAAVARLTSEDLDIEIKKLVSLMVFTTQHEKSIESGTSYLACFKGMNLRRTFIVMGVYIMQVLTGAPLRGFMTYFFKQAGLPTDQSFNMTIIALLLSVLGVLGAWVVMTYAGRRTMYLWGNILTIALFIAIGGMGVHLRSSSSSATAWGIGSLLAVDGFVANLLVLPVTFVLVSEIPSSILRSKSVVVARNTYSVVNIVAGTVTPYMLNPTAWNWGAMTGFVWAGAGVIGFTFTYFMVPESKGRTTAEMDILFERKTHVWKFKETKVSFSHIEGDGLP
ncbi:general substrate transporter [Ilyonectria robusta]|uniref:general substrate transporter n=1 Tax=Ilyonectria robusta TaxID=1079257 RepID=UPI001E8EBC35|nr:general substrate transporter [Ilyonectria robusta]KAH8665537.1 general substrate transporter [Ilyonectria robusta]